MENRREHKNDFHHREVLADIPRYENDARDWQCESEMLRGHRAAG